MKKRKDFIYTGLKSLGYEFNTIIATDNDDMYIELDNEEVTELFKQFPRIVKRKYYIPFNRTVTKDNIPTNHEEAEIRDLTKTK